MPNNLGEIDNLRIMQHSLTALVNAYNHVKTTYPNDVLESLAAYHDHIKDQRQKIEKKFRDLQP